MIILVISKHIKLSGQTHKLRIGINGKFSLNKFFIFLLKKKEKKEKERAFEHVYSYTYNELYIYIYIYSLGLSYTWCNFK